MPRVKEFDPSQALDRAMELFWRNGYAATSLSDLVEHLGIGRASLYATFGSKHELYLRALDRYVATRDPSPLDILSQPGPVLPAVRVLFERYAAGAGGDSPPGCMMVEAVVECCPGDDAVAKRVRTNWDTVEAALVSALVRARAQGELSADAQPRSLARFLLVLLQGVQVVRGAEDEGERLSEVADYAMSVLT